jgi:hypothetical protein
MNPPSLTNRSTLIIVVATQIPRPMSCPLPGIGRPLRRYLSPLDLLTRLFLL